ncbi:MAG: 2-hydroxychromene-2-carboxylate isomerase [Burkholderiaceae bacterium]
MITFYFDCSSPWTWLGFRGIQPLAREFGVPIDWRPILVGGVFNAVNPSVYESRERPVPAKARYLAKDLADWARAAGIEIRFPPSIFPINSVKAMRSCLALLEHGGESVMVPFAEAVFHGYWTDDRDIARTDVIADIAAGCGVDVDWLLEAIATEPIKQRLKTNTDDLIRRGGFGSPTIIVGDDDFYFGNDRLPLVRRALAERLAKRREPTR